MADDQKKKVASGISVDNSRVAGDSPESGDRRRAVKKILGGMGVLAGAHIIPDKWAKPLIDSVVLPVHAQTSIISLNDPCSAEWVRGYQYDQIVYITVSGSVIPPTGGIAVAITVTGGSSPVTVNTTTAANGTFSANISVPGPTSPTLGVVTSISGDSATCSVAIPVPTTMPYTTMPFTTMFD